MISNPAVRGVLMEIMMLLNGKAPPTDNTEGCLRKYFNGDVAMMLNCFLGVTKI